MAYQTSSNKTKQIQIKKQFFDEPNVEKKYARSEAENFKRNNFYKTFDLFFFTNW